MQGPAIFDDFSTSPFAVGQAYQRGHSPRVSFSAQATHIPPPKPPPMNQVFTKACAQFPCCVHAYKLNTKSCNSTNTTRVLLLSGFATELKTRDLLGVFAEWEDQGDGFRVRTFRLYQYYRAWLKRWYARSSGLLVVYLLRKDTRDSCCFDESRTTRAPT